MELQPTALNPPPTEEYTDKLTSPTPDRRNSADSSSRTLEDDHSGSTASLAGDEIDGEMRLNLNPGEKVTLHMGPEGTEEGTEEDAGNGDVLIPVEEDLIVAVDVSKKKLRDSPTAANTYAAKKTVAQGMMDIALITANANQLRYLIEFNSHSPTYVLSLVMITFSLLLQVAVGVSLIFKGRFDLVGESKMAHANRLNNYVVVGVFLVTVINVFLATFSITAPDPRLVALQAQGGVLGPTQTAVGAPSPPAAS